VSKVKLAPAPAQDLPKGADWVVCGGTDGTREIVSRTDGDDGKCRPLACGVTDMRPFATSWMMPSPPSAMTVSKPADSCAISIPSPGAWVRRSSKPSVAFA
jgi:hypothetical protein